MIVGEYVLEEIDFYVEHFWQEEIIFVFALIVFEFREKAHMCR